MAASSLEWQNVPLIRSNYIRAKNWLAVAADVKQNQKKSLALTHTLNHLFQERLFTFNPTEHAAPADQRPINLAQYCSRLPAAQRASCDMARSLIPDRIVRQIITDLGYTIGENTPATYESDRCIGILIKINDTDLGPRWACISKKVEICGAGYTWSYIDSIWRSRIICAKNMNDLIREKAKSPGHGVLDMLTVMWDRNAYFSRAASRIVPPAITRQAAGVSVAPSVYNSTNNNNNAHTEYELVGEEENSAAGGVVSAQDAAAAQILIRKRQVLGWVKSHLEPILRENARILAIQNERINELTDSISRETSALSSSRLSAAKRAQTLRTIDVLQAEKTRLEAIYSAKSAELNATYEAEINRLIAAQTARNNEARRAGRALSTMLVNVPAHSRAPQPNSRMGFGSQKRGGAYTRRRRAKRNQTRCRNRFHH